MEREESASYLPGPDRTVLENSSQGVYTDRQDGGSGKTLRDFYHSEVKAVEDKIQEFGSKE